MAGTVTTTKTTIASFDPWSVMSCCHCSQTQQTSKFRTGSMYFLTIQPPLRRLTTSGHFLPRANSPHHIGDKRGNRKQSGRNQGPGRY